MKPLEIVVIVVNALALVGLAVRPLRDLRWTAVLTALAILAVVAQVLAEGPRWQMFPSYGLAAALLVVWLVVLLVYGRATAPRSVVAAGATLGALLCVVSVVLPIVLPVFRFPGPTGPYGIGTVTYHWVDANRQELFTPERNGHRELMAQVWYPARPAATARRTPYVRDAGALSAALSRIAHLPPFLLSHFTYVTTNAVADATLADGATRYPVLVFVSGLGGFRASNTFQVEELVSRGYVVVGLDQPGGSALVRFPDGREITVPPRGQMKRLIDQSVTPQSDAPTLNGLALAEGIIPYFAEDVGFALDRIADLNGGDERLAGRLDLGRVGILGISLGAMVAAEASHADPRIRATLMMDAAMPRDVVRDGLRQPCLWITRPASSMRLERQKSGGWAESDITDTLSTMRAVFDEHAPGGAYYLEAPGMFHVNFTDAPFWSPITPVLGLTGPVDGERMWRIVNAYTVAFFDRYLKGSEEPLLDGSGARYPEVSLEKR
ncbi:MAG TPA: carboxylic ester hydrolase [Spirochaetia bacterium]